MSNKFKLVHKVPFRVRYKYPLLRSDSIDANVLKEYFEQIEGVLSVRINKKAFST